MDISREDVFIAALDVSEHGILKEIEIESKRDHIPIIRRETRGLLRTIIAAKRPERVLEVGTAVGFSAILMKKAMVWGGTVTTIENYSKRIPLAKENFMRAGMEDSIFLREGDALEVLERLPGPYDFVFIDGAKGQYLSYLREVMRMLPPGGTIVTDNVFQEGEIFESRFAVTRRQRTIHKRMREFLYEIKHNEALESVILPIGDGVALSARK